jgi:hypothetical protein
MLIAEEVAQVLVSKKLLRQGQLNNEQPAEDAQAHHNAQTDPDHSALPPYPTNEMKVPRYRKPKQCSSAILRGLGFNLKVVQSDENPHAPPTKCELLAVASARVSHNTLTIWYQAYFVRISPPKWLLRRSWEVQLSMAYSGWTFGIRSYVVLPQSSEVFQTLVHGTQDELFKLFREGRASPLSKDPNGNTLLHVRIWSSKGLPPPFRAFLTH